MTEFVKIERVELERLRNIEKVALAFKERVERVGAAGAISRLLAKKEGR